MMTWEAARSDRGSGPDRTASSMGKVYVTEVAHRAVDAAVRVLGAEGYAKPHPVERLYRDQRVLEIYEGSSEMQRMGIARAIATHHRGGTRRDQAT
ncbi:acyl-CoA dehydrogenase family protein [Pseudonocardia oroxyli]|uniref:Acyl-CoA dehydrogenase, C-terminal domain n=1 Tax=Pseudonocardia oroxyli TaxID=366584 RepID=A0A1G8D0Z8_PSEOR|nr:acyl-CoA dehydrogenase family protein [Pseudonocardia oroxyli]SDH51153.1 Acyl-CoA dehydrogenase, C-terminal domain [Pseudonocardia oroxyli]